MKNTITSRLQTFLAKIAGKNASISTLTPPVPINLDEKLMLDIADRIDAIEEGGGGGGGSDVFVVHFTDTDEDTVSDKSFEEIVEAYNSGKIIFSEYGSVVMPMLNLTAEGGQADRAAFDRIEVFDTAMNYQVCTIRPGSNVVTFTDRSYVLTPNV